jgi:hypothetical protein
MEVNEPSKGVAMTVSDRSFSSSSDGDKRRDTARPQAARRIAAVPLRSHASYLQPRQRDLVLEVANMAEAAEAAEAAKARRYRRPWYGQSYAPAFGEDVSAYVLCAETLEVARYIDEQSEDDRALLIALTHAGREPIHVKRGTAEWLIANAHTSVSHAGDYLSGQSNLSRYLRDGLSKFDAVRLGVGPRG